MSLTLGSLFSGIGGIDLAARNCGIRTAWTAEFDAGRRSVLRRHFPESVHFTDVRGVRAALEKRKGFPDEWARWSYKNREFSDAFRYRAMGDSVTVPVLEWIFRRLIAEDSAL